LNARAERVTDWQAHYRAHVGAAVAAALVGGVVLGALTRGDRGASLRSGPLGIIGGRAADALMATAMTAAVEFLAELLPGFGDEYRARSRSNG
jgi:hypothetical protein